MNIINKNITKVLIVFAFVFLPIEKKSKAYSKETLLKDLSAEYLRSFQSEEIAHRKSSDPNKKVVFDVKNIRPPKLTRHREREIMFSVLFSKGSELAETLSKSDEVLNSFSWTDLKILFGSPSCAELTLVHKINRAKSVAGECALAILLTTPEKNLDKILYRQKVVKWFYDHSEIRKNLRASLAIYADAENSLLSLYTNTDPLYNKDYIKYMENRFYAKYGDKDNKNATILQLKKVFFRDIWDIHLRIFSPIVNACIFNTSFSKAFLDYRVSRNDKKEEELKNEDFKSAREVIWLRTIPIYGGYVTWRYIPNSTVGFLVGWGAELIYASAVYGAISAYFENDRIIRELAARMYDIQLFLKTLQKVINLVGSNSELQELYGKNIEAMRTLLAKSGDGTELGSMIKYLLELPLNNWNYFFSNAGKLLAAHAIFVEHATKIADAIYELGLLDAYVGVSEMVSESEFNTKNKYCFVDFVDPNTRTKPFIDIKDMWNPFMDPEKSVPNSVVMGEGVSHIILTGPNAGGKSTFLTGVADSVLLAQAVGIAPAKTLKMTPFVKINTYIDRTDDIAAGNSLFMVEAKRAHQHINIIKNLKSNEFAFSIFDEPFSGTNPTEGAAAEYSILEALSNYQNTLNIVATHYPIVMLLEENVKNRGFANYKVFIKEGIVDLVYTYKVVPGKSTQAIAIRILEEEGFDTEMLKVAKDIISNPKKYKASF